MSPLIHPTPESMPCDYLSGVILVIFDPCKAMPAILAIKPIVRFGVPAQMMLGQDGAGSLNSKIYPPSGRSHRPLSFDEFGPAGTFPHHIQ